MPIFSRHLEKSYLSNTPEPRQAGVPINNEQSWGTSPSRRGLRIGHRVFLDGVSSDNLKECGLGLGYGIYHDSLHISEFHIQEINSSDL